MHLDAHSSGYYISKCNSIRMSISYIEIKDENRGNGTLLDL